MAESEGSSQGAKGKKGLGQLLVPVLLVLVLFALVFVILTLRGMAGKAGGAHEGEEAVGEAAPVKVFEIEIWKDNTTTNRLQQAVQSTVSLLVREDAEGTRQEKYTQQENLKILQAILVDVIQPIDFQAPRPPAKDLFESEVRRRVDQFMDEEGAVDRVLVTKWIVLGR